MFLFYFLVWSDEWARSWFYNYNNCWLHDDILFNRLASSFTIPTVCRQTYSQIIIIALKVKRFVRRSWNYPLDSLNKFLLQGWTILSCLLAHLLLFHPLSIYFKMFSLPLYARNVNDCSLSYKNASLHILIVPILNNLKWNFPKGQNIRYFLSILLLYIVS